MEVTFLKSPTGRYGLAYNAGDTTNIDHKKFNIQEMIKEGFIEVKASKKTEKRETR